MISKEKLGEIAKLLNVSAETLAAEIEDAGACQAIGRHISYSATVDANLGTHEATGLTVRELQTITVNALDYGWGVYGPETDAECTDIDQIKAWLEWCDRIGEARATLAELPPSEKAQE